MKVQLGFWVVTIVEMLTTVAKVDDTMVLVLMPYIIPGIKKRWPEYRTASFMILTQLARRTTFTSEVLESLLTTMANAMKEDSSITVLNEWLLVIVSLYQSQVPSSMPDKLFIALAKAKNISGALSSISSSYEATLLMKLFLQQLCRHHRDVVYRKVLADIISNVPIASYVGDVINELVS
jgi:hypothetical protein